MSSVPEIRVRALNAASVRHEGDFILYWMTAYRRATWNFSLQRAVELANRHQKPLVILEALRAGYPWASDRLHRFVLQGMADNRKAFQGRPVRYLAYVEPAHGMGHGLLETLASSACAVVTDDFPCFFLPRMIERVAQRISVRMEAVDSCGLLPLRAASIVYPTAYAFRRFLQKELPKHLTVSPVADPLRNVALPEARLPDLSRWPEASEELLNADPHHLADLPIDHTVGPAAFEGGSAAARAHLQRFLTARITRYGDERNEPSAEVTSGLSPYLHFGHVSVHEVFSRVAVAEQWSLDRLPERGNGSKDGWWGMSSPAEGFLDELITWRELGFNMCWQNPQYDQYESLPAWAQQTLRDHESDRRPWLYSLEQFASAETHDRLWNAAQNQLVTEGRMHNYLRMLWGKKILEWTESPRAALQVMIELNNRFAVDGRNPNSYSGIFWVLGRYDRPWGPERPVFGKIRYMSSDNTARKLDVEDYLNRYAPPESRGQKTLW